MYGSFAASQQDHRMGTVKPGEDNGTKNRSPLYHPLSPRSGWRVTRGTHMKFFPKTVISALVILVSVVAVTSCKALTDEEPTGMTLEDARTVLDLSSVLPSGFVKLDEWQAYALGVNKENLGLGDDASKPQVFQCGSPFQVVYCFLRIIEDEMEQRAAAETLFDESTIHGMIATILDFVALTEGLDLPEPRIVITNPAIGAGATLAEVEMEMEGGTLRFDMLSFRSEDKRVFGFVHSFYPLNGRESVLRLGGEIEQRITAFNR